MPSRAERRAVRHLPVALHRWQAGLVHLPATVDGVELEGVLVVAEESTDRLRAGGPVARGGELWPVLHQALRRPTPPCSPARPRTIACADPALAARLARELDGTGIAVERVDAVPGVDRAARILFDAVTELAPTVLAELPRWRKVLGELVRLEPWRRLDDRFAFRFGPEIPELRSAVAVVLGLAGAQEGLVVYPDEAAFERFTRGARDGSALATAQATCLFLAAAHEVDAPERDHLADLGLALPGGRYPHTTQLDRGTPRALTEAEQRTLLAAIEAVVALVGAVRDPLVLFDAPRQVVAATCLGPLTVRTGARPTPPLRAPTLVDGLDHAVFLTHLPVDGGVLPSLLVKLAKRDAERLARTVSSATAAAIEREEGRWLVLYAGEQRLGRLCAVSEAFDPGASERLVVGVSSGGAKRHKLLRSDILWLEPLPLRRAEAPIDAVFRGPPERWPKASDTLMAYTLSVCGQIPAGTPPAQVRHMLEAASAVWSAVSLADHGGEPALLAETLAAARGTDPGFIDALIRSKREHWPGDPRILGDVRLTFERGEPRFQVSATLPKRLLPPP